MTTTPSLGLDHLQSNSASPEIVVNELFDGVDRGFNLRRDWTITGNTTVTQTQLAAGYMHRLGGSPAGAFDFDLPAGLQRRFGVRNASGQAATIQIIGGAGAHVILENGAAAELFTDGTDVLSLGGEASIITAFLAMTDTPANFTGHALKLLRVNAGETALEFVALSTLVPPVPYDFGFSYPGGPPAADEILGTVPLVRNINLPASFAGSIGTVVTNPTAGFAIDVLDDLTVLGTITIGTDGVFAFTTASGTAKAVVAGSIITFVASNTPDDTVAGMAVTLLAAVG